MSTRRLGVGVAVLAGYLYAVGGSDGTSPLNTGNVSTAHSAHIIQIVHNYYTGHLVKDSACE